MKILAITLKNLNSLRGTWSIDLTHNAYTSSGIFAVTGPTGAGKTTIFDAVCLALYAKTPRLGKIEGQRNEIMSKHTDNCMAKVRFESGGKIYVCEWMQSRVKGKLQTIHTISSDGKQLNDSSRKKETREIIEEITGMDFDRFVQAMLLEQGEFDRFLNAGKNDRAEVLELITGTGIYSEISRHVFQRNKDEHKALDDKRKALEDERARFAGMTQEGLRAEISRIEAEISRAEFRHKLTGEILTWLNEIKRLKSDMAGVRADIDTHEMDAGMFEPERVILEAAERAMSLDGEYQLLRGKREAKKKAECNIASLSAKISSQELECSRIAGELPRLADELSRLKGDKDSTGAVIAVIEAAVINYDTQKKAADDAGRALLEAKRELELAKSASSRAVSEGKSARARFNSANDKYNALFEQFTSIRARTTSAVLDQERQKLQDGVPCPLCGSKTHPLSAHSDSGGEKPERLFGKMDALEKELKRAKSDSDSAHDMLDEAIKHWNAVSSLEGAASEKVRQCNDNCVAMQERLGEYRLAVSEAIRPLRISGVSDSHEVLNLAHEWAGKIEALEKRIQSLEVSRSEYEAGLSVMRENLETMRPGLEALSEELGGLEASFRKSLREKNFADEEAFTQARNITAVSLEAMRRKRDELSSRHDRLQGALSNLQSQLEDKQRMNLTDEPLENIETLYSQEESDIRTLHREMGIQSQKLAGLMDSAERVKSLEGEYSELKASCDDWDILNRLIGSSEGDKFRVYAQKVTLALVVNNANEYLKGMNGRYTLILTPDDNNLGLSVKDNEQAGEIRPTSNLSGGEKFIISLALALGLSQISGSKAQVDSLFIDEGFGSLDDDALSAALDALGEIRREGRMIGIISHVQGISEGINTKIRVIRKSEGTSIIEGPGCSGSI